MLPVCTLLLEAQKNEGKKVSHGASLELVYNPMSQFELSGGSITLPLKPRLYPTFLLSTSLITL